ncbi:MAG: Imm52 family immunity protein [Terracidiphilus sp.]
MSGKYFLGAYWPPRRESLERCAERLSDFLTDLAASDTSFSHWFQAAGSRKSSLKRPVVVGEKEGLVQLLERGRHLRDIPKTVIEELGFQIVLWNGQNSGKRSILRIHCGCYWESPNQNATLYNNVILDFPDDFDALAEPERMVQILSTAARAWEPDWAGIISEAAMNARDFDVRVPFVDWMVFLPWKIRGLPVPSIVKELHGNGSIIVVQPNPPSGGNSKEMAVIVQVEDVIRKIPKR